MREMHVHRHRHMRVQRERRRQRIQMSRRRRVGQRGSYIRRGRLRLGTAQTGRSHVPPHRHIRIQILPVPVSVSVRLCLWRHDESDTRTHIQLHTLQSRTRIWRTNGVSSQRDRELVYPHKLLLRSDVEQNAARWEKVWVQSCVWAERCMRAMLTWMLLLLLTLSWMRFYMLSVGS